MESRYDYIFKIILMGHDEKARWDVINRFINNTYDPDKKTKGIGVDFYTPIINIKKDVKVKLQLWDLHHHGDEEPYPYDLDKLYLKGSSAIVILVDLQNEHGLENVEKELAWIQATKTEKNIDINLIELVGVDNNDLLRRISKENIEAFAAEKKITYTETNPKENVNITEFFQTLTEKIYNNTFISSPSETPQEASSLKLTKKEQENRVNQAIANYEKNHGKQQRMDDIIKIKAFLNAEEERKNIKKNIKNYITNVMPKGFLRLSSSSLFGKSDLKDKILQALDSHDNTFATKEEKDRRGEKSYRKKS